MRGASTVLSVALLAAAGFAVLPSAFTFVAPTDDGVVSHGAERILLGEAPYRDFWHFMAPGGIYLYAGVFSLFGVSIAAARCAAAVILLAVGLVLFRIARRFLAAHDAALFAVAYGLTTFPLWPIPTHHWPSTLTALVAAGAILDGRWILCGAAAGLTLAFHQAKGVILLAGILAAAACPGVRPPGAAAACGRFLAGALAALAPILAALSISGAVPDFLDQAVWGLPARWAQWIPYNGDPGGPLWLSVGNILIAYGGPAGLVFALWRSLRGASAAVPLPLALLAASLWASCLYRPDAGHIYWSSPLAALVAFSSAISLGRAGRILARGTAAYAAGLAAILVASAVAGAGTIRTRRGVLLDTGGSPVAAWVGAVEERVAEGERTFISPYMSGLYFYTGVRNVTSYEILAPGIQSSPGDVARAIRALEADPPAHIFDHWEIYRRVYPPAFPAAPAGSFGRNPLADVLDEGYEPVGVVRGLVIWRRRG